MESELDLLLGTAIDSLPKLELLLYLHHRAGAVGGAGQIGTALGRPAGQVASALEQLAAAGLIERFALGTGRHVVYGATKDEHVRQLLGLLDQRYHQGPDSRSKLLEQTIRGRAPAGEEQPGPASEGE